MTELTLDYNERVAQIEKYLVFIWITDNRITIKELEESANEKIILDDDSELNLRDYLNDGKEFLIDNELVKIFKSNTILLFYNLIEGTICSIMNEYFDTINKDGSAFKEFKLPIKKIWLKYKHKSFASGNQKKDEYIISTIESILEEVVEINSKSIRDSELGTRQVHNYDAYSAETRANEISGNLDARKIRELFSLYGLPEVNQECNAMLKVKNKRNSLAHGNETFTQVGSNFTIQELYKMKVEITNFLRLLLDHTNVFLVKKSFKHSNV